MPNILSIDDLTLENINNIITLSLKYESSIKDYKNILKGELSLESFNIGLMFFEPSTRTMCSFETAINKSNGKYIKFIESSSSIKKGESLYDTIKTMESYCDLLIIRHPMYGIMEKIKSYISIPLINAGDGSGEHPTQALLDLYTIKKNVSKFESILFVGDNKNSRTIKSLIKLLRICYPKLNYYFLSINGLEYENNDIEENYINIITSYDECVSQVDVIYMTRIQKERFNNLIKHNYQELIMTPTILNKMKSNSILMHPLPRNEELDITCDSNSRSKYFEQMENGIYVRMAILNYCLLTE